MKIAEIKEFSKTKYKIFTDEEISFVLYKRELQRYGFEEGAELDKYKYHIFVDEILPKRAKERSMKLLQGRDYTEYELQRKLRDDGYPESVIYSTVKYLKEYHYLDDIRYIQLYYHSKSLKKSKKQIIMDLQRKGLDKELINPVLEEILSEADTEGDLYCIKKFLAKKKYIDSESTFEEKEKIKMYLFRKGFDLSDISHCMKNFSYKEI